MNKRLLILSMLMMSATWFYGQGPGRERIKTLKVAFITERLNLTSEEAQSFWPIYNEHEKILGGIRRNERIELKSQAALLESMSEEETSELLDKYIALHKKKYDAQKDFIAKIRKVIPPKKTLLLLKAEEDFKKRLLQQYRKRKMGGG
ncbi:hypothetical protein [Flagellimonas sp. CMM7]|uniref:hypothetical protein n=1 Tax=Flagellimonas sp. CMM7 TaxID=2654676 RepID=UPI0013D4119C|nr:hypothetical protein [Flagellimonas sp. CMM7]UII79125.1 hypothetical protein LV704_15875 [Flagellimonas sp. CMM7]